jgi:RND family efflux transporter MFP subunit
MSQEDGAFATGQPFGMGISMKTAAALFIGAMAAMPLGAEAGDQKVEAITKPCKDVSLAFVRPGQIAKVFVKNGDQVKAGQELVVLDDVAERIQIEQLKAQEEDTTRLQAARAQLDQKKVDLKKMEEACRNGGATALEVDHAKLDVTIADLSVQLAGFEQKQAKLKHDEAKAQIDRMRLVSPIDGFVLKVLKEQGESADALEKVIRLVKIDPLKTDVAVPKVQADGLKTDMAAVVEFLGDKDQPPVRAEGKITFIANVDDAASETVTVTVETPNPSGRRAGQHVRVVFPAGEAKLTKVGSR